MLKHVYLKNFKCFDELALPLGGLTLITGVNGAGKSSIVQALLLLRQSNDDKRTDLHTHVKADGDLADLTNGNAMRYALSEDTDILIRLTNDQSEEACFTLKDAVTDDTEIACIPSDNIDHVLTAWPLFAPSFVYLYADRTAPQSNYRKGNASNTDSRLGDKHGSNTAFRFYEAMSSNEQVPVPALCLLEKNHSVFANVSAWLSYIMGSDVSLAAAQETADRVTLSYSKNVQGNEIAFSPLNVAFGNSYILPIILAVLTAPENSLLIIENPEAHLHPSAQFRTGQLLALAAEHGIQIIVETHSDHLLNGVRVMAKAGMEGKGRTDAGKVEIHYIYQDKDHPEFHLNERIVLEEDGTLDHWPQGFFDEWELALRQINQP
ncbi:AAA family ATPase [Bacteroides ndongoniae]|uniref:AAA family ATPase n=1 Tax=Bacteroides ndongoniae TaxID=1903262 RepID=UPI0008D8F99B|nr:DUF3696 domain-containing protein [Bacteroides ndongoniae]